MKSAGRYAASVLIVGSLAIATALGFTLWDLKPLLGLDLVGGVSVVLKAPDGTAPEVVDRTLESIRQRVDALGVVEPDITRQGDLNIQVQVPRQEDEPTGRSQSQLLDLIGRTAQMEFRIVEEIIPPGGGAQGEDAEGEDGQGEGGRGEEGPPQVTEDPQEDEEVVLPGITEGDEEPPLYRLGPVQMEGNRLTRATARPSQETQGAWEIAFQLDGQGAREFADLTRENVNSQLAIVLDDIVQSAPTIQTEISGGEGVITGDFTEEEARDLATILNAGALPVELERQEVQTVSPTLGEESLRQGLAAAAAGIILLALYLFFYYRVLGIVTWFGMTIWSLLALGLVSLAGSAFGYSLTLAGVAGLVVSLGITADSYIVFYERLKDEVRHGKTLRTAVAPAFQRAWRTIIAADIVTIAAAIILYLLAIGSVRGFALTLGLATGLDMFVVYFFKRPAVYLIARSRMLSEMRGLGLRSSVAADPEPEPVRGGSR